MITNLVKKIDTDIIEVPVIVRAEEKGWVPTFDIWQTKVQGDISYIDCTQTFGTKSKKYQTTDVDPRVGYYNGQDLIIYWKALVDSADLGIINEIYKGKLRATSSWDGRYCTYFGKSSTEPRLHSVILPASEPNYVVHHINEVAVDNRRQNFHLLPKAEHDKINNSKLSERKKMFRDPESYWQARKRLDINDFIMAFANIISEDSRNEFIAKFAVENMDLVKEILEVAKLYINLSGVNPKKSKNRLLNQHLPNDYLDAYEIEKYLKAYELTLKRVEYGQIKWF